MVVSQIEKTITKFTSAGGTIKFASAGGTIRIYHEHEGGIEKSDPRITDWHHKAC